MDRLPLRVLIADDEAVIRSGLRQAINWEAYNAQIIGAAANGKTALSMILKEKPDLAVIDIKMPLMDGLEVIRRVGEAGVDTRFIILSGYDDFALAQKAIRYGACAYFLKPLKIDEFEDELSHQIREISVRKNQGAAGANLEALLQSSRTFFLNQLIANEIRGAEEIGRRASLVDLPWLSESWCIIACSAALPAGETLSTCLKDAAPALNDAFAGIGHEVFLHGDEVLVCAAGVDKTSLEPLHATLATVMADLQARTGHRFYAGIGKAVCGASEAAASYASALRALSYHLYEQPGDVYDNTIICRQEPSFDADTISCEPLLAAIEVTDTEAVRCLCHAYVDSLFFVALPPPDFLRAMCIRLITTTGVQFRARHPDLNLPSRDGVEHARTCHTVGELCRWLEDGILLLARQYRQMKENADPVIRRAKQFIHDNIHTNIKAKDIAAVVNLSESYFTVYFKQKTGQNFRDYVLAARTDLAKALLSENRLTVGEIAAATGYQDYRSLSRAFKNVTGIPPSGYQSK